jgi:hypothetical protein
LGARDSCVTANRNPKEFKSPRRHNQLAPGAVSPFVTIVTVPLSAKGVEGGQKRRQAPV